MTLEEVQRAAGAVAAAEPGPWVPQRFGDPAAELRAAREAAGLVDRSTHRRLVLTGRDRADYLHRITAQALKDLRPPAGRRAALLERTGKLVDLLAVHAFPDHILVRASAACGDAARDWLRRYVFRADAQVEDRTAALGELLLVGPQAAAVAAALAGAAGAPPDPGSWVEVPGSDAVLLRTAPMAGDAFALIAPAAWMAALWERALQAGGPLGLRPVGEIAFQAARILAGVPEGGREIDAEANPLELGLGDALDMGKGCFTGQEALAKMITHRAVRRRLAGLDLAPGTLPLPGSSLNADGEAVGRVTSALRLPDGSRVVALALVRTEHAEPGTRLAIEGAPAVVQPLPFPRR